MLKFDIREEGKEIKQAEEVHHVLDMLIGDYLQVYGEGLREQIDNEETTRTAAQEDYQMMCNGIHLICKAFNINPDDLDIDGMMPDKYGDRSDLLDE